MTSNTPTYRQKAANSLLTLFALLLVHNAIPHHHLECSDGEKHCEIQPKDVMEEEASSWDLFLEFFNYSHPEELDQQVKYFSVVKIDDDADQQDQGQESFLFFIESDPSWMGLPFMVADQLGIRSCKNSFSPLFTNDPLRGPPSLNMA